MIILNQMIEALISKNDATKPDVANTIAGCQRLRAQLLGYLVFCNNIITLVP